MLFIRNVQYYL